MDEGARTSAGDLELEQNQHRRENIVPLVERVAHWSSKSMSVLSVENTAIPAKKDK